MSKALNLFFFLGRPFSPVYSTLMKTREKFYHTGIFRQHPLSVPVISIGNLVMGGTGKTPIVEHTARLLLNEGFHPAIISHGYGGSAKASVNIVSDGRDILLSPEQAGDEPYMLAQSLPEVPVLTGRNRLLPCRHATDRFNSDILILDDGFQHLTVKRSLDIVLFDSTTLAGNSRVFPGGPLREPISAMNRSHAFLLTGENIHNQERSGKFKNLLQQRFPNKPVFKSSTESYKLLAPDGKVSKVDTSKTFFGFCSISNPSRFQKSLTSLGIQLVSFQALKNHTPYNRSLVHNLCKKAAELGAKNLVTTEKDYTKLQRYKLNLPLYVLQVQNKVEQSFDLFLLKMLNK